MAGRVIYVDVDDTLVRSAGTKRMPVTTVVARVREWHAAGEELYLWSSVGAAYARSTAEELGIDACFTAFLPKPHVYVDDQPVRDWRYCRHVLPANSGDT